MRERTSLISFRPISDIDMVPMRDYSQMYSSTEKTKRLLPHNSMNTMSSKNHTKTWQKLLDWGVHVWIATFHSDISFVVCQEDGQIMPSGVVAIAIS